MTAIPSLPKRFDYHVLFSYTADDAKYVGGVKAALEKEEVKAFDYAEDGIWGEPLEEELQRRYTYDAPFCVVFISQAYLKSKWTAIELKVVQQVADKKRGYMLPVVLDGTVVPEIEDIAWLDKRLTPEQLAKRIVEKICAPPRKPWWFYLSMEVKVGAAALLLALILFARPTVNYFRPSRTSIASITPEADVITAQIANSGPKNSTLVGQRLKFGTLPIKDAELRLESAASATIPPAGAPVRLKVLTLEPECGDDGQRLNNRELEALLPKHTVTLEVNVQESDDAPGHPSIRTETIAGERLNLFVRKWVPGRVPPCDSSL